MITFKTLEQVKRRVSQQATVQQLLNRRMSIKGQGWVKIALSEELENLKTWFTSSDSDGKTLKRAWGVS